MKNFQKICFILVTAAMMCTGCSSRKPDAEDVRRDATEPSSESSSEFSSELSSEMAGKSSDELAEQMVEQHPELFGTTDRAGKWIPPEDSTVKDGYIYNKEGVLIGVVDQTPRKARPGSKG